MDNKDKQIQNLSYENIQFRQHIERQEKENQRLLFIIEQQNNLLDVVVSMVDEIRKPTPSTESGVGKLIALDTLIHKFLYYKQHPNELSAYLKAIRGN